MIKVTPKRYYELGKGMRTKRGDRLIEENDNLRKSVSDLLDKLVPNFKKIENEEFEVSFDDEISSIVEEIEDDIYEKNIPSGENEPFSQNLNQTTPTDFVSTEEEEIKLPSGEKQVILTTLNQTGPIEVTPIKGENIITNEIKGLGENDIFDKYRLYLNQVRGGYLRSLPYPDAMEILRYCEGRLGRTIPMNHSCGSCMMDLVILFGTLEKK